jgi:hypothetical protein
LGKDRCDFTKSLHNGNRIVIEALKAVRMDIDALHSTLLSIALISEKLRSAREDLAAPDGTRPALGKFLDEVESDLRVAKATLAGELGFSLCPNCWPPVLVAIDLDGQVNVRYADWFLTSNPYGAKAFWLQDYSVERVFCRQNTSESNAYTRGNRIFSL